ncbi:MAG: selenium-dependent molybdenum cofactor biosynthesis protein YqeB [Syntrophorhabdaceae bacterium]|nr:selenium-dependent molybdenum cofactor biosynthesis protein YqeB [Syntrophorhabdaceae bacterium]
MFSDLKVVIKGAGEMATGIAHRLYMAGIKKIVMTEIPEPLTVRRTVAFSEAVFVREHEVEGVGASLVSDVSEIWRVWEEGRICVIIDPKWRIIGELKPYVVIDAIMAKRNLGTSKNEAPVVIGVGPGFSAPDMVHAAVESNRGHNLGRVYYKGKTEDHTGIPGPVMGHTTDRVLRSPKEGKVRHVKSIGDLVKKGEILMYVDEIPVLSPFDGVLRGLIGEIRVEEKEKIGDVDPTGIVDHCYAITEKARAIGGGVLEAILHFIYF